MLVPRNGTVIVNPDGRIAYASTYACDLTGIDIHAVTGMSCFDFVFPEDIEEAKQLFEQNKLPDAPAFKFRLRRLDGTAIWVDIQGTAIPTSRGETSAITVAISAAPPPD